MTIKNTDKNISAENEEIVKDIDLQPNGTLKITKKNLYTDSTTEADDSKYLDLKNIKLRLVRISQRDLDNLAISNNEQDIVLRETNIFLVPLDDHETDDADEYKEMIWSSDKRAFEKIGTTRLDLDTKVDKVQGKGLSQEDYTTIEKQKLAGIDEHANNYRHPTAFASSNAKGFYLFSTDEKGHVTDIEQVEGADIPQHPHDFIISKLSQEGGGYVLVRDNKDGTLNALDGSITYDINEDELSFTDGTGVIKLEEIEIIGNKINDISTYPNDTEAYPSAKAVATYAQPKGNYLTSHQDISGKVDKVSGKGLSTNDFTDSYKNELDNLSNNYQPKGNYLTTHQDISGKVDKVSGKSLSSNDFTDSYKNELDNLSTIYATKTELNNAQIDSSNIDLTGYLSIADAEKSYIKKQNGTQFSLEYADMENEYDERYYENHERHITGDEGVLYGVNLEEGITYLGYTREHNSNYLTFKVDKSDEGDPFNELCEIYYFKDIAIYTVSTDYLVNYFAQDIYDLEDIENDSNFNYIGLLNYHEDVILGKNLANVAWSGDYNDLENKPTIPDISGKANKTNGANEITDSNSGQYTTIGMLPPNATQATINNYINSKFVETNANMNDLEVNIGVVSQNLKKYITKLPDPLSGHDNILLADGTNIEQSTFALNNHTHDEKLEKSDLLDFVYPIGSIYMSVNNVSPATFLGGTWVQLTDTFLYASSTADDNITTPPNDGTRGEETHTLTINEMPSHNHKQNTDTIYLANGTGTGGVTSGNNVAIGGATSIEEITYNTGGGRAHNNMPPYIKVYMWKRVSS